MSEFWVVQGDMMPSLALPTMRITEARESEDLYVLKIRRLAVPAFCPKCDAGNQLTRFGRLDQEIRDTPIHGKHVRLIVERQRCMCRACGATSLEKLDWLHDERRSTRRLVTAIERDCLTMPNIQVAHKYGVDDKTIKNILDGLVQRLERDAHFETPEWLGIDELKIIKNYRAVITNIGQETLIEMLPDRNKATIIAFLRTLDAHKVKVVTMDMWQQYRDAVREVLPHAAVTVDKFHVVRLANDALDTVRKSYRKGLDAKQRRKLRNDRFTLLKRRKNLTEFEVAAIESWRKDFPDLIGAYELKEMFYGIYDASTAVEARRRYARWLSSVPEWLGEGDGPWDALIKAMTNWQAEIMAYFDHRVTNAFTESMNRVIRDIDRAGRGHSFGALRAKAVFGQEFRKKPRLASQSKRSRGAFMDEIPMYLMNLKDLRAAMAARAAAAQEEMAEKDFGVTTYGADLHLVAAYLEERALRRKNRWRGAP